jgi:FixJ family two-component response regulator
MIHIVEDDPAVCDSLKLYLETHRFGVQTFGSGAEILDGGDCGECNCLIMDVNLAGNSGFDVLATLREKGFAAAVIFISGGATAATRARASQVRAEAFFDKPVPPKELLAAIVKATGHTQQRVRKTP